MRNQQSTISSYPASAATDVDSKVFLKLLQLDLNAHPPGAPIMKIHLAAEPARPVPRKVACFPPSPEPEKLELTLARIAGMVGENKVGALELLDTHHPDGFRMRRFVAEVARKTPQRKIQIRQRQLPPSPHCAASVLRFGPMYSRKWPARACRVHQEKRLKAMCSGKPARGAPPATGGNAKPGPVTSGTSLCETETPSLSTASCTTC